MATIAPGGAGDGRGPPGGGGNDFSRKRKWDRMTLPVVLKIKAMLKKGKFEKVPTAAAKISNRRDSLTVQPGQMRWDGEAIDVIRSFGKPSEIRASQHQEIMDEFVGMCLLPLTRSGHDTD
jgi:hypothetical protein